MPRLARHAIAGAALLAVLGAAPAAESATADGLRAILAFVPATASPPRKGFVDYTDLAVAAALTGKRGLDSIMALMRRAAVPTQGENLGRSGSWPDKVGFALDDVEALASAGEPPHAVHIYRLAPTAKLETLKKVWVARGFAETNARGIALWGRGEAGKFDLSKIDADDPFGGTLGRSSFLLPALPFLAETFVPDSLVAAAGARAGGGLAARADVKALLAALDRGGGQLLQAVLLPEPAASLTAPEGIAPYSALLLADIEHGTQAETLVMLAFAGCASARAAETAMPKRWAGQVQAIAKHAPAWQSREDGGPCVLTGTIAEARPAAARNLENSTYPDLLRALFARDLTALEMRAAR